MMRMLLALALLAGPARALEPSQTFDGAKARAGGPAGPLPAGDFPEGGPPEAAVTDEDPGALGQLQEAAGGVIDPQASYRGQVPAAQYRPGAAEPEKKKDWSASLAEAGKRLLEPFGGYDPAITGTSFLWGGLIGVAAGLILATALGPAGLFLGLFGGLGLGLLFNWLK